MWPENVGILALEIIFPSQYVDQAELEEYDKVATGKYTIGLGQKKMGFCSDRDDINSLCLTVVKNLMERNELKPQDIGRLEVGTETIIDKSKSVKSILMQLFDDITDIEGIDTTNACYGGTAALFNAISWIESSAWNGRLAIVVAGDIAVYAKGSARPTGGAGAVAMLVGPNAPLIFERGTRATFVKHTYDFYKPDLTSEYPIVDGKLSIQSYLGALDNCYQLYKRNFLKKFDQNISIKHFNSIIFHSPYCKLVQKSLARLCLNDFIQDQTNFPNELIKQFKNINLIDSYFDRDIEKAFLNYSSQLFDKITKPSLLIASEVGNMYTPSLYGGLVSFLISKNINELIGNKIGLFSYGSGLAASFFSIKIIDNINDKSLNKLINNLHYVKDLLNQRVKVPPKLFEECLELREKNCHKPSYIPQGNINHYFPGTYYLDNIDDKYRRFYKRIPQSINGHI